MGSEMKCVSAVVKFFFSRKFNWLVLILIVIENKLSQIPNVGHLLMNFSKPQLFKSLSAGTFSGNASL